MKVNLKFIMNARDREESLLGSYFRTGGDDQYLGEKIKTRCNSTKTQNHQSNN